jgi:hypothetical protein
MLVCSPLKRDEACFSEMLVSAYKTTRCQNLKYNNHRLQGLNTYTNIYITVILVKFGVSVFEKLYLIKPKINLYPSLYFTYICISQRSHGLRHKQSSLARKLEVHSRHGCLCAFTLCSCCPVCR